MKYERLMQRMFAMLDQYNSTTDPALRNFQRGRIDGFRTALDVMGYTNYHVACDMYYLDNGVERDMTCGLWHEPDAAVIDAMWARQKAAQPTWLRGAASSANAVRGGRDE